MISTRQATSIRSSIRSSIRPSTPNACPSRQCPVNRRTFLSRTCFTPSDVPASSVATATQPPARTSTSTSTPRPYLLDDASDSPTASARASVWLSIPALASDDLPVRVPAVLNPEYVSETDKLTTRAGSVRKQPPPIFWGRTLSFERKRKCSFLGTEALSDNSPSGRQHLPDGAGKRCRTHMDAFLPHCQLLSTKY